MTIAVLTLSIQLALAFYNDNIIDNWLLVI